jgi:hypothetical protein
MKTLRAGSFAPGPKSREDSSLRPDPNPDEVRHGVEEFERQEKRNAMYKVATFLVSHFWGDHARMAEGLGVLLMTWNQAFYRYGSFDFDPLEQCIRDNWKNIQGFRDRELSTLAALDVLPVTELFSRFLDALQVSSGPHKGRKSPVSVAKALHLLAPTFFPLWDEKIARAYGCYYKRNPAQQYLEFCKRVKLVVPQIDPALVTSERPILKVIDEYNYARFTKRWI